MPNFTQPPLDAYEILVRSYDYAHALVGERSEYWAVVDVKLFGRSLLGDFRKLYGSSSQGSTIWPSMLLTKRSALAAGHELAVFHRDRCYTIEES